MCVLEHVSYAEASAFVSHTHQKSRMLALEAVHEIFTMTVEVPQLNGHMFLPTKSVQPSLEGRV